MMKRGRDNIQWNQDRLNLSMVSPEFRRAPFKGGVMRQEREVRVTERRNTYLLVEAERGRE